MSETQKVLTAENGTLDNEWNMVMHGQALCHEQQPAIARPQTDKPFGGTALMLSLAQKRRQPKPQNQVQKNHMKSLHPDSERFSEDSEDPLAHNTSQHGAL